MQNKIINQLSDCLSGKLNRYDAFNLSLLMIAWAKLSVSKSITDDLRVSGSTEVDLGFVQRAFETLSQKYQPFEDVYLLGQLDSRQLQEAVSIIKNIITTGVIDSIDSVDFNEFHSTLRDGIWFMPSAWQHC